MGDTKASDLRDGDRVDFKGNEPFLSENNKQCAPYEYASISMWEQGGWADGMAKPGEIVLYTDNFPDPIILPADTVVHVERWH
jgi:hypothetical protein